jgi:FixJ family two-component response regulator
MTAMITPLPGAAPADRAQDLAPIRYVSVVDDDASVRRALARLIGAHSFHVKAYQSGREFLDSLKIGIPGCLIVDLQMDDMTGLELLHRLAVMGLRIPTIVVTARDEPGIRHATEISGAFAFLVKPVMKDPLLKAIEAAMSASGCAGAQAHR